MDPTVSVLFLAVIGHTRRAQFLVQVYRNYTILQISPWLYVLKLSLRAAQLLTLHESQVLVTPGVSMAPQRNSGLQEKVDAEHLNARPLTMLHVLAGILQGAWLRSSMLQRLP